MYTAALTGTLGTVLDLLMVVMGFSFIVFVHELGHFIAARWAGIRVLAFSIGFGGAIVSFRKGLGVRLGSSDGEYRRRLAQLGGRIDGPIPAGMGEISPTEYRLNWLPLGGYVKMLGQEDDDPTARSDASDAYQSCKPWKRMIVISAGVVMNVILAAVLFVIVFSAGLKTESAVVGAVELDSAAARAGVQPGDEIVSIDGRQPDSFKDVAISVAMARAGEPLKVTLRRPSITPGAESSLVELAIVPEPDQQSKLLSLGVYAGATAELSRPADAERAKALLASYERVGLAGVRPGSELLGPPDSSRAVGPWWLDRAASASGGKPFAAKFRDPSGGTVTVQITPKPELQFEKIRLNKDSVVPVEHLLGIVTVMMVKDVEAGGKAAGLQAGDVMAQIGAVEYPSLVDGIAEIRSRAGGTVPIVVERAGELVDLGAVKVAPGGLVGFTPETLDRGSIRVAGWPRQAGQGPSFTGLGVPPGSTILSVAGREVASLADVREALTAAFAGAAAASADRQPQAVTIEFRPPAAKAQAQTVAWSVPEAERTALAKLGWLNPVLPALFEPDMKLLKGDSIGGALALGFRETHRVMVQTYLTFARLFQGSVKVEHLKGPVGIAHVGTLIADRGFIWLLFFMAVISVNLAVINFLPLPIVDGGHLLFLMWEHFTGRPVSVMFQNVATIAGLAMIGTVFLVVTYNDIARLITGS